MPALSSSMRCDKLNIKSADLEKQYTLLNGAGNTPEMLDMLIIFEPLPINGKQCFVTIIAPKMLTFIMLVTVSVGISSSAPLTPKPALLTSTSILPNFSPISVTTFLTSSSFETSHLKLNSG